MRRGFSLLEFLIFCALLLAASTVLLPRALAPRQALNEEQAVGYLGMIGAAQQAWSEVSGGYVSLVRLVETPPQGPGRPEPSLAILLTPEFLVDEFGVGHRGGFRFRLGRGAGGAIAGCWAWPNLRGYSGESTFWADFARGEVRRVRGGAGAGERMPQYLPEPDSLEAEVLARF